MNQTVENDQEADKKSDLISPEDTGDRTYTIDIENKPSAAYVDPSSQLDGDKPDNLARGFMGVKYEDRMGAPYDNNTGSPYKPKATETLSSDPKDSKA